VKEENLLKNSMPDMLFYFPDHIMVNLLFAATGILSGFVKFGINLEKVII